MEFSETRRGNRVVLYKGYEYSKFRQSDHGVITWRCRTRVTTKCAAYLKTKEENVVGENLQHCHDSNIQKAKANILKSKMRQDIKKVGATPKSVIENVLSDVSVHILQHLPKRFSLERNLEKHRDDVPNPETANFLIPENYANIILSDTGADDPERILAIGNPEVLLELDKDVIYGDGTFDKSPCLFEQLFTWHAKIGNSYPPCIYFLLQKKNLNTYSRMFAILQQLLPTIAPCEILLDFEEACMSAARLAFPKAEVKGCYFHLCQNLSKKINSVGLKEVINTDIDMKLILKSLAALSFVPIPDVRNVLHQLFAKFPDDFCYTEVLTYFFTTYIEGIAGRPAKFPVKLWNHFEAADEGCPKTNNCWKSFHNVLMALLNSSHTSIWSLLDGLKRDIARQHSLLEKVHSSEPKVKKKRSLTPADRLAMAVRGYQNQSDKLKYLCQMANFQ